MRLFILFIIHFLWICGTLILEHTLWASEFWSEWNKKTRALLLYCTILCTSFLMVFKHKRVPKNSIQIRCSFNVCYCVTLDFRFLFSAVDPSFLLQLGSFRYLFIYRFSDILCVITMNECIDWNWSKHKNQEGHINPETTVAIGCKQL